MEINNVYLLYWGFSNKPHLSFWHQSLPVLLSLDLPYSDWCMCLQVGSAALGQLLVWEWRSESYVLKQQGHYYDVAAAAFSPDGGYLVTGADDAKVRWRRRCQVRA